MTISLGEHPNVQISPLDAIIAAKPVGRYHDEHLVNLALQVHHNLQYQHRWTNLRIHYVSPLDGKPLARPLISGLPPRKLYVHPDEQAEMLRLETERSKALLSDDSNLELNQENESRDPVPELEWVLPSHIREEWSLNQFTQIFGAISHIPPDEKDEPIEPTKWRMTKRVLLAIVDGDSTIVYYFVHDGMVKPRQN
jgi:tRNA-splicing endonuclease subunit Sen15, fungi type